MISDEGLMLDFQRAPGLRGAFARYHEPLYGFFRRRLGSAESAEDLTQETFLALIRATARYEPRALVRTYLAGVRMLFSSVRARNSRERTVFTGSRSNSAFSP